MVEQQRGIVHCFLLITSSIMNGIRMVKLRNEAEYDFVDVVCLTRTLKVKRIAAQ